MAKLPEIGKQVWLFRYSRKEIGSNVGTTEEYHFLVCQGKYAGICCLGNPESMCQMPWKQMPRNSGIRTGGKMVRAILVRVAVPRTKSSLWSKSSRNLESNVKISLHALSILKKRMTEFFGINFGRFCGSMALMVSGYAPLSFYFRPEAGA